MAENFQEQKKDSKAKLVSPPNLLKNKTGGGGFDPAVLTRAQAVLEENTVDFRPIAASLLEILGEDVARIKDGSLQGVTALEALLNPAMQLRAQGAMFHYPLITEVGDILVTFLETIAAADKGALDIVEAHVLAINVVISGQIKDSGSAVGKRLCTELADACKRYYKARKD